MTATRTIHLVTLLLGAVATAAILLVIDPAGATVAGPPGGTVSSDDPDTTDHHAGHQRADDRHPDTPSTTERADGVRDFGGIGTLDGTTEGTLARFREMDPERLAGLHRHHRADHHGDPGHHGH
jgi:hypothetical protein